MGKPKGSNKLNLERTRAHLLRIATTCFSEYGYAHSSTTVIIKMAKSSRGSLYHHFSDKKALFKAVYDSLCADIAEHIHAYPYKGKCAIGDLMDGCIAYLKIFTNQTFAQVVLIDGPHVLGMDYCRSKDTETAYKALHEGVDKIVKDKNRAQVITDFISGALDTYALRIALSDNREKTCEVYSSAFKSIAQPILY